MEKRRKETFKLIYLKIFINLNLYSSPISVENTSVLAQLHAFNFDLTLRNNTLFDHICSSLNMQVRFGSFK